MSENIQSQHLSLLIHLLDDPDQEVYEEVSREILNAGIQAVDVLENAWLGVTNELQRSRIEDLIHNIQFQLVYDNFEAWCEDGATDLMEGYLIASGLKYPNIDETHVLKELDILTRSVWIELNENTTSIEKIKILNHVFFEIYKVGGELNDINQPDSFFLNNLVQTWRGNAVSVGILYLIIAQKLSLPVRGVDLPGNFIACYTHDKDDLSIGYVPLHPAKFYINPMAGGAIFTRKEIDFYIDSAQLTPSQACYNPASNKSIMKRWFKDLLAACLQKGELTTAADIKKMIQLLD